MRKAHAKSERRCVACEVRIASAWICADCANTEDDRQEVVSKRRFSMKLASFRPMSPQEEVLLATSAQNGDVAALQELVMRNMRLALSVVLDHMNARDDAVADALQESVTGLISAVMRFNPKLGCRLSTYATLWVRARVFKYILANWSSVKGCTTQAKRRVFFHLNRARNALTVSGHAVTDEAIAEMLGESVDDVSVIGQFVDCRDESIDDLMELGWDVAGDDNQEDALTRADTEAFVRRSSARFLRGQGIRERAVIEERWLTPESATLRDLGDRFCVSRERMRQIERRALDDLRKDMEASDVEALAA